MSVIELYVTRDEALWLKAAARRAAQDAEGVPEAKDGLFKLAKKIGRAIDEPQGAVDRIAELERELDAWRYCRECGSRDVTLDECRACGATADPGGQSE